MATRPLPGPSETPIAPDESVIARNTQYKRMTETTPGEDWAAQIEAQRQAKIERFRD